MLGLELVVALGVALLVGNLIGERLQIPVPMVLLTIGIVVGFIPALHQVELPPEVVLLLFLPVLLYWESITTSLRALRRDLRGIVLTGTVLVIATAAAAAAVARALGLPWGPAWVLGGAVAPTDATATGVLGGMLPPRNVTLLRAESLINDGTALVVYGVAVSVTVGREHFSVPHVLGLFLLAYFGGIAAGAVTAWFWIQVRRRVHDPLLGNVVTILTPFSAFLLAEAIDASGVLAVVVAGLIMMRVGPRLVQAETRRQAQASWSLATFLLNGSLFVLVGIELHPATAGLAGSDLSRALWLVLAVTAVLIAVRTAFLFAAAYLIRVLDRRPQQRLRRVSNRARVVSGLAGFRGAVSLAAALAVPTTVDGGAPFPDRDTIVFVTAGVIVLTLLQGLLLPAVVRWAQLPSDTTVEDERRLAETTATQEALLALPELAASQDSDPAATQRLQEELEHHLTALHLDPTAADDSDQDPALRFEHDYTALRLALVDRKRATMVRLRDEHRIDDAVLRQFQSALDNEELRLTGGGAYE